MHPVSVGIVLCYCGMEMLLQRVGGNLLILLIDTLYILFLKVLRVLPSACWMIPLLLTAILGSPGTGTGVGWGTGVGVGVGAGFGDGAVAGVGAGAGAGLGVGVKLGVTGLGAG